MRNHHTQEQNKFNLLKTLIDEWYRKLRAELSDELANLLLSAQNLKADEPSQWIRRLHTAFPSTAVRTEPEGQNAEAALHQHDTLLPRLKKIADIAESDETIPQSHLDQKAASKAFITKLHRHLDEIDDESSEDESDDDSDEWNGANISTPPTPITRYELETNLSKLMRRTAAVRELKCGIDAQAEKENPMITPRLQASVKQTIDTAKKNEPSWWELPLLTQIADCLTLSLSYRYRVWQRDKLMNQTAEILPSAAPSTV